MEEQGDDGDDGLYSVYGDGTVGDGDNVTAGSATGSVSRRRVLLQLLAM